MLGYKNSILKQCILVVYAEFWRADEIKKSLTPFFLPISSCKALWSLSTPLKLPGEKWKYLRNLSFFIFMTFENQVIFYLLSLSNSNRLLRALPRHNPSPKPYKVFLVGENTSDTSPVVCYMCERTTPDNVGQHPNLILQTLSRVDVRKQL